MNLTCPLPEEQNTRGRKIYPPEESAQGFGVLTLKKIPKVFQLFVFLDATRYLIIMLSDLSLSDFYSFRRGSSWLRISIFQCSNDTTTIGQNNGISQLYFY